MKRPFAVIGLSFISALAVFFHFYSYAVILAASVGAAVLIAASTVWKLIRRDSKIPVKVIAVCFSVLTAFLVMILFQNYIVRPVTDKYSDKELYVTGYCTDMVTTRGTGQTFVLQTVTIDGEAARVRVFCCNYSGNTVQPFENIEARITPGTEDAGYQMSKRIYLKAFLTPQSNLTVTGKYHSSPYSWVVKLRRRIKENLYRSLDGDAASLSSAVLLGDKKALPSDILDAFTETGTSYLIVVSGMHLTILSSALGLLLRRLREDPVANFLVTLVFSVFFIALTGAYPSVIRAGIMLILVRLGAVANRDADGLNSLGIAALALTAFNPYAVGDVGMLLSFSATCGILLWSDKLRLYFWQVLHILPVKKKKSSPPEPPQRLRKTIKRALRGLTAFIAVSLSATLWVIPVTIIFFGSISPLTVAFSLIAYPLTAAVLLLSMIFALFGLFRITLFPLVPLLNQLSYLLIAFIKRCSRIPFSQIDANEGYFYVWIAVSAVLVAAGYLIKARKPYVIAATAVSILTLSAGAALTALLADHAATLTVTRNGFGCTAEVRKSENISLLSCGGNAKGGTALMKRLERIPRVDYIVLTNSQKRHTAYLADITENMDVSHVMMYEKQYDAKEICVDDIRLFDDNTAFTLALNSDVSVRVMTVNDRVYRYVYSDKTAVLLVPDKGVLGDLPEAYLRADAVIFEGSAKDTALAQGGRMISLTEKSAVPGAEVLKNGSSVEFRF